MRMPQHENLLRVEAVVVEVNGRYEIVKNEALEQRRGPDYWAANSPAS